MIIEIFKYFARFPRKSGTLSMARLQQSPLHEYADTLSYLQSLPDDCLLPDIDSYVYAQSFDDLQQLIQKLTGTFLMVDYGEITFQQQRPRRIDTTQQIAVTVATKVSDRTDALERLIVNDRTLSLLTAVYSRLLADSDEGAFPWADRDRLLSSQFVPFVATELGAIGWTMMLELTATDPFDVRPPQQ